MALSKERTDAISTYPADLQTVGDHIRLNIDPGGDWIDKLENATHIRLQVLTQNIRYTVDESQSTLTHGFQLAVGVAELIPCPNNGISVFEEAAGAIIQFQWFR